MMAFFVSIAYLPFSDFLAFLAARFSFRDLVACFFTFDCSFDFSCDIAL